jgi:hypothetical protein
MHPAGRGQLADAADIDGTPDAPALARGETDRIARFVAALADAVYPAEAQRLVERLLVRDPSSATPGFVEAQEQFPY